METQKRIPKYKANMTVVTNILNSEISVRQSSDIIMGEPLWLPNQRLVITQILIRG
jgi:hypothetical protein